MYCSSATQSHSNRLLSMLWWQRQSRFCGDELWVVVGYCQNISMDLACCSVCTSAVSCIQENPKENAARAHCVHSVTVSSQFTHSWLRCAHAQHSSTRHTTYDTHIDSSIDGCELLLFTSVTIRCKASVNGWRKQWDIILHMFVRFYARYWVCLCSVIYIYRHRFTYFVFVSFAVALAPKLTFHALWLLELATARYMISIRCAFPILIRLTPMNFECFYHATTAVRVWFSDDGTRLTEKCISICFNVWHEPPKSVLLHMHSLKIEIEICSRTK